MAACEKTSLIALLPLLCCSESGTNYGRVLLLTVHSFVPRRRTASAGSLSSTISIKKWRPRKRSLQVRVSLSIMHLSYRFVLLLLTSVRLIGIKEGGCLPQHVKFLRGKLASTTKAIIETSYIT